MSEFYHSPSAPCAGINGFTPAVKRFLEIAEAEKIDLLYAQLRINNIVIDDYTTHPMKTRLNTFAVAEAVVGVAVGIAIDEGLLALDEKLCESFPEYVRADTSMNLLTVTVRNMLTMKTGLKEPLFFSDDPERYRIKDWIQYFFDAEFTRKPDEVFLYSNFNTYMLACLIEKKAGINLLEYLRDRLFEPIGIGNPDWLFCPKGHIMGANGLYLTVEEMGIFGQLVLCGGEWIGKRIVSKRFITMATTKQVETGVAPNIGTNSNNSGYGYHFWISHVPNTFLCKGRFGQCCVIAPDKDAIFTFQALEGYKYNFMFDKAAELPLLL